MLPFRAKVSLKVVGPNGKEYIFEEGRIYELGLEEAFPFWRDGILTLADDEINNIIEKDYNKRRELRFIIGGYKNFFFEDYKEVFEIRDEEEKYWKNKFEEILNKIEEEDRKEERKIEEKIRREGVDVVFKFPVNLQGRSYKVDEKAKLSLNQALLFLKFGLCQIDKNNLPIELTKEIEEIEKEKVDISPLLSILDLKMEKEEIKKIVKEYVREEEKLLQYENDLYKILRFLKLEKFIKIFEEVFFEIKSEKGFLIPLHQLIKHKPAKIEFIVEQLIPANSLIILGGKGGSGKSTFCSYLAYCVSKGTNFGNLKTRRRNVLLVNLEEPTNVISERFKLFGRVPKNLYYWFSSDSHERLIEIIEEGIKRHKIGLIIIDNLAAFLNGVDENDASKVMECLKPFIELRDKFEVTILLIHHHRKSIAEGLDHKDVLRGSSVIYNIADIVYYLEGEGEERVLYAQKNRFPFISIPFYAIRLKNQNGKLSLELSPTDKTIRNLIQKETSVFYNFYKVFEEKIISYINSNKSTFTSREILNEIKSKLNYEKDNYRYLIEAVELFNKKHEGKLSIRKHSRGKWQIIRQTTLPTIINKNEGSIKIKTIMIGNKEFKELTEQFEGVCNFCFKKTLIYYESKEGEKICQNCINKLQNLNGS